MKTLNLPKSVERFFTRSDVETSIPSEFETYIATKQAQGLPTNLNSVIFALVDESYDPAQVLPPPEMWTHQAPVSNIGKSGTNAVVYSVIVGGEVEPFSFNSLFLHEEGVAGSCGMIIMQQPETKQAQTTITKSFLMQFDGAPETANVIVDASTWQIDVTEKIKEVVSGMMDKFFPVGHTLITKNPANPSSYGYFGVWEREQGEFTLEASAIDDELGQIVGDNLQVVPLPSHTHGVSTFDYGTKSTANSGLHSHSGSTATAGNHTHAINLGSSTGGGSSVLNCQNQTSSTGHIHASGDHAHALSINNSGDHAHSVAIGAHTHNITATGEADAKMDVRGTRMKVAIWTRVA